MLSQNEFLRNFTDKERLDFNDELFIRDEDEIVTELMKVILSAQRNTPIFTILVDSFTLTEDYETKKYINLLPGIKKVIYNKPATIILWKDNTKTKGSGSQVSRHSSFYYLQR